MMQVPSERSCAVLAESQSETSVSASETPRFPQPIVSFCLFDSAENRYRKSLPTEGGPSRPLLSPAAGAYHCPQRVLSERLHAVDRFKIEHLFLPS
jgi:hypothetical protein